jgi:hypothetical protein
MPFIFVFSVINQRCAGSPRRKLAGYSTENKKEKKPRKKFSGAIKVAFA